MESLTRTVSRTISVVLFFGLISACASHPVALAPTPVPVIPSSTPMPLAKPLSNSVLDADDDDYALYLEKRLADLPKERDDRLLLDYVRYLHYGHDEFAKDYIKNLMAAAEGRDGPVADVEIFESDYSLCLFQNERCVKSLGDLTRKYFVPRVRTGDAAALELLVIQHAASDADDLETDSVNELLDEAQNGKFRAEINSLRRKRKSFLSLF